MLDDLNSESFVVGLKQFSKMLEADKVKKVYLASDADFYVSETVNEKCKNKGVSIEVVCTMSELGKKGRIKIGAAVVSVLK